MHIQQTIDDEGFKIEITSLTISLCMIVRDKGSEWVLIENALSNAVGSVNEIIILTDKSFQENPKAPELSRKYGVKFVFYDWHDSFSELRNKSIFYAKGKWILVLDADEVIFKNDLDKMKSILSQQELIDVYDAFELPQATYNNNTWDYKWSPAENIFTKSSGFNGASVVPIIRLFKNGIGLKFKNKVHEVIDEVNIKNRIGKLNIPIHHLKYFKGPDVLKNTEMRYLNIMEGQVKEDPENVKLLFDAGITYRNIARNFEKSLKYLKMALDLEESSEILIAIGKTYSEMGNTDDSLKYYERACKKDPKNPVAFANVGFALMKLGRNEEALKNLKKAVDLGIDNENVKIAIMSLKGVQ